MRRSVMAMTLVIGVLLAALGLSRGPGEVAADEATALETAADGSRHPRRRATPAVAPTVEAPRVGSAEVTVAAVASALGQHHVRCAWPPEVPERVHLRGATAWVEAGEVHLSVPDGAGSMHGHGDEVEGPALVEVSWTAGPEGASCTASPAVVRTLTGRLVDGDGAPLRDAIVHFDLCPWAEGVVEGRFQVPQVAGRGCFIRVQVGDRAGMVLLPSDSTEDQDLGDLPVKLSSVVQRGGAPPVEPETVEIRDEDRQTSPLYGLLQDPRLDAQGRAFVNHLVDAHADDLVRHREIDALVQQIRRPRPGSP